MPTVIVRDAPISASSQRRQEQYHIEQQKHEQQQQQQQQQPIQQESQIAAENPATTETETKQKQEQEQEQQEPLVIDILSVGSLMKGEVERASAQKETFGRHPAVRQFRIFNELDDYEQDCHRNLTMTTALFISGFCRDQNTHHSELMKLRSRFAYGGFLQEKKDAAMGWMCAIKRVPEALYNVLREYARAGTESQMNDNQNNKIIDSRTTKGINTTTIPNYLFLLDADTFVNMEKMLGKDNKGFLPTTYPSDETIVIGGCRVKERVNEHNFTFPWGGFGTFFSKRSIERFIQPIHNCGGIDDDPLLDPETKQSLKTMGHRELTSREFERLVCAKVEEDLIGEAFLFDEGMTVADLMYKYVTHWNYVDAEKHWKTEISPSGKKTNGGFCLHADWVIGYFVNHYYLSNHDGVASYYKDNPEHRLVGYDGSELYAGRQTQKNLDSLKQCKHDYDHNCDPKTAHICHHVSPAKMREMMGGE
eukprot:CAMPEP_0172363930 /NCGR_PEP_ID=MMETSP1060-20121228/7162_1 /TAXON_ID=37318 /ORGANISM="Pseudo-nitzschia pungens, Strain cf. cingulata" /LENGTH=477 /DNA_ID=CAMNT_0013086797 /DNA_START=86 /DNA_END=1517 /DNA_ORIENTATION=+